ncbi:MAG TPA: hypothetical protein VF826_15185 [Chloroflexia bacterium]
MDETTERPPTLLQRIGWHPSDLAQIDAYALMTPARKVELMLRWRGEQIGLLKARLEHEHPGCSTVKLSHMLQEHLDLVRETRTVG